MAVYSPVITTTDSPPRPYCCVFWPAIGSCAKPNTGMKNKTFIEKVKNLQSNKKCTKKAKLGAPSRGQPAFGCQPALRSHLKTLFEFASANTGKNLYINWSDSFDSLLVPFGTSIISDNS